MSYLDNLIEEKEINPDLILEVVGNSGTNYISLSILLDKIKQASRAEKAAIRKKLKAIDFIGGDVLLFLKHLAQAIAI